LINHRYTKWVVALSVGLLFSLIAYQHATDPEPARQKAYQESLVMEARDILASYVSPGGELQLVDPLAPDRKVGKVYIWPTGESWEVSGFYRRDSFDTWHPFLMRIDSDARLESLAVRDGNERLIGMSAQDPLFSAVP